ncbi:centrosomal protein of 41 kDa isoform X1 [Salvelinus fontinalis]|uniref:centrosomal protein of 41 kDa isoform X1 n=1 Tax=Salvelinus fontinalis TaxID=8038 RepID=UPI002486C186|nr:centrosomal protein of 41 kDa isoform X1 [Salvelinus fontinalis]
MTTQQITNVCVFPISQYMKRRIPQNPKYQHVRTRLDTGCSLTKYVERLEEIKKNYRYRKDELFKRLKVTTFAQLVIQVASVSDLNESVSDGETPRLEADMERLSEQTNGSPLPTPTPAQFFDNNNDAGDAGYSPRSTLQSVISGVGELDLDKNGQNTVTLTTVSSPRLPDGPYPDCPYLLLDVRDREQYDQCHIISAYSYPIATLSRTMNPYTKEVLDYKNVSGKIIIVYDEDERIAAQAATAMCERGFQNLFMLSGGLKVIAQKFPEGMTTGTIPASCLPSPKATSGRKCYTHRQVFMPADRKWRFTSDDMANIQAHLEEMLVPSDTNSRFSSRMSTSSAQSKASSARSLRTSSLAGSETARSQSSRPWK